MAAQSSGGLWNWLNTDWNALSNPGLLKGLGNASSILSVSGAITGAIGSFYAAQSQQIALKSQASSLKFQARMADINARGAEFGAQQTLLAGERAIGTYTMRAGQQKASNRASMAARGIDITTGSPAQLEASMDLAKQIDVININANAVRQAEALRIQGANYRVQGTLAGASASNLQVSAGTISPWAAGFTSLLGGATAVAQNWANSSRMDNLIAKQSMP